MNQYLIFVCYWCVRVKVTKQMSVLLKNQIKSLQALECCCIWYKEVCKGYRVKQVCYELAGNGLKLFFNLLVVTMGIIMALYVRFLKNYASITCSYLKYSNNNNNLWKSKLREQLSSCSKEDLPQYVFHVWYKMLIIKC